MTMSLEERCRDLVARLDLAAADQVSEVTPLTGGVASDIAMVRIGDRRICVKFALSRLKVAEDWRAPVHRNRAEYEWLRVAAEIAPDSAVKLYGRSEEEHGFAMEFIAGDDAYLWKTAMLEERRDRGEAAKVGDFLGRVHAASTRPGFDATPFQNRDDFHALRIEPYLLFTASQRTDLAPELTALADMLYKADRVLAHGDVSPKNILFRGDRPILLDAECATMGDASFDPAFCLNHLVLKAVHLPGSRLTLLNAVGAFWRAYRAHVDWEDPVELERRASRLLPALMLARIDGKSPVEYLAEPSRALVRTLAVPRIKRPVATLEELVEDLSQRLESQDA